MAIAIAPPGIAAAKDLDPDPAASQTDLATLVSQAAPSGRKSPLVPAAAVAVAVFAQTPDRLAPLPRRWSASAWFAARPGTGLGAAPGGGQIGGSQAGVRIAWLLAPKARVSLFGRVVGPLSGKGREVAVGAEWQPTRAPVRLVVEQRFGLDGTKGGPGLGVIAGYDTAVATGFRLESYGQAGVIRRTRTEPYADGAARITRQIVETGGMRLAIGAGVWGAAQRDAARLDIGPSATLALPIAGQNFRFALDWRQRVAGDARPGSGPAFTVGVDF
ncbi:hypothetical protein [Sphingomonas sp. M1-B02]|uniref:hypothetical protein n=1 Tax=Sphingomonas sp. M1-B02 TaxID=3114300 RepID=UPI00223F44FA|nr:hypothetical protein [Sphingomonas sp. S6-11]UZK64999.1 hypothetical protein OKW87_10770 [Sphingomonas sp. S6-11]